MNEDYEFEQNALDLARAVVEHTALSVRGREAPAIPPDVLLRALDVLKNAPESSDG